MGLRLGNPLSQDVFQSRQSEVYTQKNGLVMVLCDKIHANMLKGEIHAKENIPTSPPI